MASGADANTLTTIGNYYVNINAISQSLVNFPIKATLTLKVESSVGPDNTAYLIQTVRNATTNETYERRMINGVWGSWVKLPTRDEVDFIANVGTSSYGGVFYSKFGKFVIVSADLNIPSAVVSNGVIATGLPVPRNEHMIGLLVGGNSWSRIRINSNGELISFGGQSITGYCKIVYTYAVA